MAARELQSIQTKLGQTNLKVDGFFLRQTGFIANQTILKLGEYNLHCVPASLGLQEGRFLAALTPTEVSLFSKFKEGTNILILTFDDPEKNDIARYHLRVSLLEIAPLAERKNICMISLRFKSLPAEYAHFLGDFVEALESRQASWETSAHEMTEVTREIAATWGDTVVLTSGAEKAPVEIHSFQTRRILLRWPDGVTAWTNPASLQLRFMVRGQPLVLEGALDPEGAFLPEFQPDWLDLVEEIRFQQSMRVKSRAGKTR